MKPSSNMNHLRLPVIECQCGPINNVSALCPPLLKWKLLIWIDTEFNIDAKCGTVAAKRSRFLIFPLQSAPDGGRRISSFHEVPSR